MLVTSTWSPATARKVHAVMLDCDHADDMPVLGDLFERVAYGDPLAETEKMRYISELLQGALPSDGIYGSSTKPDVNATGASPSSAQRWPVDLAVERRFLVQPARSSRHLPGECGAPRPAWRLGPRAS